MTDFGTMSVTRSLSISTRNPSTTSGIPHFQSGFGTFYGSMPLKDHDLTSMTYPGFYGNHSGEFFPSQPVTNGLSINSMTPGSATCHQQQFQQQQQQHNQQHHHQQQLQQQQQQHQQQHQQQQQNKRRGEWITFSKPFLLKLVEKLCQLSFETEVVPSPALEVNSQGGVVDQKVKADQSPVNSLTGNPSVSLCETTNNGSNYSPSISLSTTASTTATTTPLVNVQTSNDKINNNNSSSSGVCSRKSRQKSRPVKFVRPFESSEERQKSEESDINVESDDDDDTDDTTMKKIINKSSNSSNSNAISAIVSPASVNPTCVAVTANSSSAVTVVVGKTKENLKRERAACEDSETEHVNVEDDDDDDGGGGGGDTNASTAKTKTTDHPGSENIHRREGPLKDQSILERSFQPAKLHFNPGSSSAPPPPPHHHHHLFNPLWSEYFKLNFGLQPTYQPAFNSQKGASQAEPSRQSWAAFNKSLVYKMFDEVLDNDKTHNSAANYQPSAQPAQSSLHDARFLFASHRPGHLGLHLSNGLDKHLGTYDVAFCQGRIGQVRDSHDDDRENKRTSIGQVRNKRLRDGFARGRHQLISRRNKARNSCATKGACPRNSDPGKKEQSERSNCKETNPVCDVPILGALLSSNDTKLYSSHRSVHYSVNNNNNNNNNSNKNVKVCSEQQHNTILKPTTTNNNNSPISCDIPMKNGLHQNPSSGKVEGWPKWVALDKGQVKSLVDSLVATMMGTGDGQSPSSCHSMTPPPPKSRDDDYEMQVDGNSNDESSPQQQQTATSNGNTVEEDIKESADVNHATSNNSSGTSTYQSPESSPKSCGIEIERSAPPHNSNNNNNNNNENSNSSSNRDSETETNFSGDTQLDQSDLDECSGRQVEEDMSDDGESSARDADTDDCARMECHSTHRRCPIKWKSNMLKRMKAEKRRPET